MKLEDEIKQSKFTSSRQKVLVNIIFTANWVNARLSDIIKSHQITLQQYNVLRILRGKYPKSANPGEIKAVMLDKNPDLTRLCDRMCTQGLISRNIDEVNRRKMNICITDKGLEVLEQIDPEIHKIEQMMVHLQDAESEQLSDLLDRLRG
ncbi:MAG: MarR family winged helix-turn-helix transcriptional regulator [Sphingomonadales bacterium]|jgi:DNA-binding MarR family transcriptional regulator